MIPVVFINCRVAPFIDLIMRMLKLYETRTRDTLRSVVGQRVLLAETGRGRRPLVRCSAVIGQPVIVRSRSDWRRFRKACRIAPGSTYDWQPGTNVKYLYPLLDVVPLDPFTPPEDTRHGRVWMEYTAEVQA